MALHDFVGVVGLGVGASLGALVGLGWGCLYVEEGAFHYFLEGFAVWSVEEVPCSLLLLLFLGLGVD